MKYIAWLNNVSVASGTRADVERKAREIYMSSDWRARHASKSTELRITTYGAQKFVAAYTLPPRGEL